ncbi:M14 family zinc carboxypeptidase [uncultured Rubinisphaera sp.]|uniref:M14 family zinc carboxypeptidase n=2 Tax=Rubinisphaera TaxID=1649490 RepID=UPI0030DC0D03|tara:strand:- start:2712 stop:4001 length:1290 start_codon:yes stop_codon:yes gene_type:complete
MIKFLMPILFITCTAIANAEQPADSAKLIVDTNFEGASARVLEIDHQKGHIRIMPDGNPERGWPVWWYCRVAGLAPDQEIQITVHPSIRPLPAGHPGGGKPLAGSWAMPAQASWSADGNRWQKTSPGKREEGAITYSLTSPGHQLWIAWGPPATPSMTNNWMDEIAEKNSSVNKFKLTTTREGREVNGIRIMSPEGKSDKRPVLWFQARQHAWESGSSWVARGIGDWLTGDSEDARWIRNNMETYIVPIMDVDRAATGDGGKEADPHDHNRDWSDKPHYPEVAAAQKRILDWSHENRLAVFIDLHNPAPGNKTAYFYISPDEAITPERRPHRSLFLDTIHQNYSEPIPLSRNTQSTGPGYHPLWNRISHTWVNQHCNENAVAVCLETAWNLPQSTTEGYQSTGAGLMKGIARFLKEHPHSEIPNTKSPN